MSAELNWAEMVHTGILIYLCSALPFIGLHGALVFAAAMRFDWIAAFLISSAGAITSLLLMMQLKRETIEHLRRWRIFETFFDTIDRYIERHKEGIEQHAYRTLAFIVAAPFTGIGALAACALAKLLDLEKRRAEIALSIGVTAQCLLTAAAVYGLLTGLRTILGAVL